MERAKDNQRNCVVCEVRFTKQGRKVTCSIPCKESYKEKRVALNVANRPEKKQAKCLDLQSKDYILDRIIVNESSGCWEWQQSLNPKTGYGQIGRPPHTAHKLSFILWKGELASQVVRHRCHNKSCCNPNHLLDGTHADNYNDSYDVHMAAATKRRGRVSNNAIPVTVNGIWYNSKLQAMQQLSISWNTLHELI
jgi:hypothetical protein